MGNKTYSPIKKYTFDYNEDLKDERWIQKSLALRNRAKWTCERCGAVGNVVVHHPYYLDGLHLWDYPDSVLKVYCEKCHSVEHNSNVDPKDVVTKAIQRGVPKGDIINCIEELIIEKSTPMPSGVIIAAQNKVKNFKKQDSTQISEGNSIPKEKNDIIYIPYSLATCGFTASESQLRLMIAILKQLKSQLRQMQCNYFLCSSEIQTLFSQKLTNQTELEILIHLNDLGVKSSHYQDILNSLLNNNDSCIRMGSNKVPIYKSIVQPCLDTKDSDYRFTQANTDKNFIRVVIDRHIADYIFNDKKGVYSLSENVFRKLKGKYTKRLYMYLSVFRKDKRGFHEIDFWTFRNSIGFEDNILQEEYNPTCKKLTYPLFSEFKKRVLEPSRKAIEELAQDNEIDFIFTYEPIKHGYRSKNPKAIRFFFKTRNNSLEEKY